MFTEEMPWLKGQDLDGGCVMLGTRRTVPLWRKRQPQRLALERALAPGKPARDTQAEQAVIGAKMAQRRLDEAKRRMRFSGVE
jgi:hypothetical protein